MKKLLSFVLCIMILAVPAASANPFTVSAKPAASWSLSDAMEMVGEEIFAEMLTEVKQNIINNLGKEIGIGFTYSPYLHAIIDSMTSEGIDPHDAVYRIGDDSADMTAYFTVLMNKGYIAELPSSYTEEIANEIRKIQYAAGLPATGEITHAIARGLLTDAAIPSNEETLRYLAPVSERIVDHCTEEMNIAQSNNLLISNAARNNAASGSDAAAAAVSNYKQAREYLPSFVLRYQLYRPVADCPTSRTDSETDEEAANIVSNSSALLSILFYYAQYDLRHDFTGYAVEYEELLKSEKNSGA